MSEQVTLKGESAHVIEIITPAPAPVQKASNWFMHSLWFCATLAIVGVAMYFAKVEKFFGHEMRDLHMDLISMTFLVAQKVDAISMMRGIVLHGFGFFMATIYFCKRRDSLKNNALFSMLASLMLSGILHLIVIWPMTRMSENSCQGAIKGIVITYLSFAIIGVITAMYQIVKYDGFDKSVLGSRSIIGVRILAAIATTLFGLCFLVGVALSNPMVTLICITLSFITSSAAFWIYTGKQMYLMKKATNAIAKEELLSA